MKDCLTKVKLRYFLVSRMGEMSLRDAGVGCLEAMSTRGAVGHPWRMC